MVDKIKTDGGVRAQNTAPASKNDAGNNDVGNDTVQAGNDTVELDRGETSNVDFTTQENRDRLEEAAPDVKHGGGLQALGDEEQERNDADAYNEENRDAILNEGNDE